MTENYGFMDGLTFASTECLRFTELYVGVLC